MLQLRIRIILPRKLRPMQFTEHLRYETRLAIKHSHCTCFAIPQCKNGLDCEKEPSIGLWTCFPKTASFTIPRGGNANMQYNSKMMGMALSLAGVVETAG